MGDIEDVELLWAQFVLQAYDAAIALRIDSMRDNIQFASETLDVLLWAWMMAATGGATRAGAPHHRRLAQRENVLAIEFTS